MNSPKGKSCFEMVGEFHRKFHLPVTDGKPPSVVDEETFLFRHGFLAEELLELEKAQRLRDLALIADALADLVYVAVGTAHMYGIPFDEVFEEVHRVNMKKERAVNSSDFRSKRSCKLDVVKPEGWKPPDINGAIINGLRRLANQ